MNIKSKDKFWKCRFLQGNILCLSTFVVVAPTLTDALNKLLESLSEDFIDRYLVSIEFDNFVD